MGETNYNSYWERFARQRQSRRRVVKSGLMLASGATALALVGCGSDDSPGDNSGLLQPLKDRSKEAVRGGVLNHTQVATPSLDAIGNANSFSRMGTSMVHTRLFKVMPGTNEPASGERVGDTVENWELSPEGTKLTLKIRPNLGTDPRPPVNGRNLDASDVLFSWNRWSSVSSLRSDLVNSLNADAPVRSVTAPDKQTVVFDLAFPSTILMDYLTDGFYLWVMPKESDGGYNPNSEAHGAGPYYMEDFLQGVHYKMTRNPNYYDQPLPYIDKQNWYIIPEAAAQLAQFEAKQLDLPSGVYTLAAGLKQEDVVGIKNRHDGMLLFQVPVTDVAATSRFGYGAGSPFRDVRIRRAVSMCYDRDALSEYFTSKSDLEASGLTVEPRWASHISAMFEASGDPSDPSKFGENAKYFAYNIAEARKLLQAANSENLEFTFHLNNADPANIANGELISGALRDSGLFKVNAKIEDLNTYFLPTIYRGRGNWNGMAHGGVAFKYTPESFIFANFHPSAGTAHYNDPSLFPDLVRLATAVTREFDTKKREQMVKEFEHTAAGEMPTLPVGSSSPPYTLKWPWLAQAGVLRQWPGDTVAARNVLYSRFWIDQDLARTYGKA